ncbi:MAG TPA: dual specificity protein phosphatase family protein [Verrucomicrobiae bacterium]|nr:dual specificity protein phosphatase family protein [Verrucomicrobiae bacterium]
MNSAFSTVLALAAAASVASGRGLPAQEGILNFGRISEAVYRGAQPDANGIKSLQKLGVKLIINLRRPGEAWSHEAEAARACGIQFTNVPMKGLGRPTTEQVKKILALIESAPGPVFVHCEHGCDRTGTIIACWRIQHDHWTSKDALVEAKRYGMSPMERGMRRYVEKFGGATGDQVQPPASARLGQVGIVERR